MRTRVGVKHWALSEWMAKWGCKGEWLELELNSWMKWIPPALYHSTYYSTFGVNYCLQCSNMTWTCFATVRTPSPLNPELLATPSPPALAPCPTPCPTPCLPVTCPMSIIRHPKLPPPVSSPLLSFPKAPPTSRHQLQHQLWIGDVWAAHWAAADFHAFLGIHTCNTLCQEREK